MCLYFGLLYIEKDAEEVFAQTDDGASLQSSIYSICDTSLPLSNEITPKRNIGGGFHKKECTSKKSIFETIPSNHINKIRVIHLVLLSQGIRITPLALIVFSCFDFCGQILLKRCPEVMKLEIDVSINKIDGRVHL